jgi:gamma-glutamylcyclotransferase
MLTARMKERAPSARKINVGHLTGYRLDWNKRSKGSGECSVTETGQPQDVVWGVSYEISSQDKPSLDLVEGSGYGQRVVRIETQTGHGTAVLYYATSIDPGLKPYDWYRDLVVAGAREHKLPEEYIRTLEGVATITDTDKDRSTKARHLFRKVL